MICMPLRRDSPPTRYRRTSLTSADRAMSGVGAVSGADPGARAGTAPGRRHRPTVRRPAHCHRPGSVVAATWRTAAGERRHGWRPGQPAEDVPQQQRVRSETARARGRRVLDAPISPIPIIVRLPLKLLVSSVPGSGHRRPIKHQRAAAARRDVGRRDRRFVVHRCATSSPPCSS